MKATISLLICLLVCFNEARAQSVQLFKQLYPSGEFQNDTVEKKTSLIDVLPNVITTNSPFQVIPSIKIIANNTRQDQKKGVLNEIRVFTSGTNFDTSVIQNGFNFLTPDASKFGFNYSFARIFSLNEKAIKDSDRLVMFTFNVNLLSKEAPSSTVNDKKASVNYLAIHSKAGLEWLFIKDFLSIYTNLNAIGTGYGVDNFKNYFNLKNNKLFCFLDYGIKAEFVLNSGENDKNNLILDLGFIHNGGDIHSFVNQKDVFTPYFRIGFAKLFEKNTQAEPK